MDWNVLVAALGSLAGVAVGALLTYFFQRDLAARQLESQRARDEAERLVAFRQPWVLALQEALGDLIALAIREVPQRPTGFDEILLDPDKWPTDWKMMHEEQDRFRERLNRLALMSLFPSTVNHARAVAERIDDYAKAEDNDQLFIDTWDEEANESERSQWLAQYNQFSKTYEESREDLLETAYAFRRHLEALVSRPESDPGPLTG